MNNTTTKKSPYKNIYSGIAADTYNKIIHATTQNTTQNHYATILFAFENLVTKLSKKEIAKEDEKDAMKAAIYMRAYLFPMSHMEYPEDLRRSFFESCWSLSSYLEENEEKKNVTLEPEITFLSRAVSSRIPALLSIWEKEELSHGICTCCGKELPVIKFADCSKQQHTPKLIEEWDLPAVAKNMTLESKDNFSLYKKVTKTYGVYTCKECGNEELVMEAYMNWIYTNAQWARPDEKLLEWLYAEYEALEKCYDSSRQRRCYCKLIADYMQELEEQHKPTVLKYMKALQDSYKYERDKHAKQLDYFTQKCKELVAEVLAEGNLSKEEKEICQLVEMDLQYDEIGKVALSQEETEEKYKEFIAFYDKHLGKGNSKSHNCIIRMAISMSDYERAIEILLEQLKILKEYNPNAKKEISRVYELISYTYREKLKNYQYAILYYKPYLRYIEETYGRNSEYAFGERLILKEMNEKDAKRRRKQAQERKERNKKEKLKRKRFSYSIEEYENKNSHTMIEEILTSNRLPHIEEIVIGCWGECYEESAQAIIDGIVEHKEQFQHIKSLFVGDMDMEECEVSWIVQADYSKLWEALPNLEKLTIKGSTGLSLGTISHGNLKELEIICGGLPKAVIQSIANANLPELTSLNLYIGVKEYGFDGDIEDIKALLSHPFPKLTKLGLLDSEIQDEIVEEVVKSPYMNQISELSLSQGTLSDKGGALLLEEVPKHSNIIALDLEYHYMSAKMTIALLELPIDVNVDEQQDDYEDDGTIYRYPMLTE